MAYLLFTRAFMLFSAVFLTLYFLTGSSPVRHQAQEVLADVLPGGIQFSHLQWGPLPWEVRISHPVIYGEHGEEVIRLKGLVAHIDWGRTVSQHWNQRHLALKPLTMHFSHVDLLEPFAAIRIDENDFVGIERAFVIAKPKSPDEDTSPSPPLDIHAHHVRLHNGGALVEVPGLFIEARGIHTETSYSLTGKDYMSFDVPSVILPEVDLRFTGFSHVPAPIHLKVKDLHIRDFSWRDLGFSWSHGQGSLPQGTFESAGWLDTRTTPPTWGGEAYLDLKADSPLIADFFGGLIYGALRLGISGQGDVKQVETSWVANSEDLRVGPWLTHEFVAQGRFSPRGLVDEQQLHAIFIDQASFKVGDGAARVSNFSWEPYRPRLSGTDPFYHARDLSAVIDLDSVDALALLQDILGLPFDVPASWKGEVLLQHLARPEEGRERISIELSPTTISLRQGHLPFLAERLSLSGQALYERAPEVGSQAPLTERFSFQGLQLDAGETRARISGAIDLAQGQFKLEPYLRLGNLAAIHRQTPLLGPDLAPSGRLVFKNASITGAFDNPTVHGELNWTEARLGTRALGHVHGLLTLRDGRLHLKDFSTRGGILRLLVDGVFTLFETPEFRATLNEAQVALRRTFELRLQTVEALLQQLLIPVFGENARIQVEQGAFKGRLLDPLTSLSGRGRITITQAEFAGERGVTLTTWLDVREGTALSLSDFRLLLPSGTAIKGDLRLGPGPIHQITARKLEGQITLERLALHDLALLKVTLPELALFASGHLQLSGTLSQPSIDGTLSLQQTKFAHLDLGDATFTLRTRPEAGLLRHIDIEAEGSHFFQGFNLQSATLTLRSLVPQRVQAEVLLNNRRLGAYLPKDQQLPFELHATAAVKVDQRLDTGTLQLEATANPSGIHISSPDRQLRWTNISPLNVRMQGNTLELSPLRLQSEVPLRQGQQTTFLEACGRITDDRLSLELAGALDLALIPNLSEMLSVARGHLAIVRDRESVSTSQPTCSSSNEGFLAIRGSLSAPHIDGRLESQGMLLVPRGSGREIRIQDGAPILFRSPTNSQPQRVLLGSASQPFKGELDDGSFSATGVVNLKGFMPDKGEVSLVGADLFLQSSGEFAVSVSPLLKLQASELDTPTPKFAVSGDVTLSDGRFYKSFDTFSRAVGGALGVRSDAYSDSLLETLPWIGQTRLNVNVVANDFLVQTALPLAKTDLATRLDLTIRGTIAEPQIFRRIDLLPGGRLSYFVFERTFNILQGSVDFDGPPEQALIDVTAQTPITYVQRAQTASQEEDEKEVAVTLRMSGRLPDLKIELSSDDPSLDQADIQSLLLTGKPRGDLDKAQENQLVSADLATVLNSILSSPFVRRASVGVDQRGSMEYRVGTCFAPNLCFDTTTVSDDTETTLRAKFSLAIGDDVVCEGTLRRSDNSTSTQDTYQARCRYRIPLE